MRGLPGIWGIRGRGLASHFTYFPVYVDFIIETQPGPWRPGPKLPLNCGDGGNSGLHPILHPIRLYRGSHQKCSLITLAIILAALARLLWPAHCFAPPRSPAIATLLLLATK